MEQQIRFCTTSDGVRIACATSGKGRLLLRMEDSRNVSGWIGAQELLLKSVRTIDDAVAEMDAVTLDDVNRVAREYIDPVKAHLAVVGPYRSEKRFAGVLP